MGEKRAVKAASVSSTKKQPSAQSDGMETQSEFGDETDMDEAGSERGERGALTLP